jgi:hypothetical protein
MRLVPLALLLGACAVPAGHIPVRGAPHSYLACFQQPEVQHYLLVLLEQMVPAWLEYGGQSFAGAVTGSFSLDESGALLEYRVIERQGDMRPPTTRKALRRAAPFPPLRGNLVCAARQPIPIKFSKNLRFFFFVELKIEISIAGNEIAVAI